MARALAAYGEPIITDAQGNLNISSTFGNITDHAPESYQNGTKIISSFKLEQNVVSFQIGSYDTEKTIVIDPWITTPTFSGTNKAYDIDWDYKGNIYVYGGHFPFEISKLNSTGVIQWTYTNNSFTGSAENDYGDFALDRNT